MFQGFVYTLTNLGVTISTAITVLQFLAGSAGAVEVMSASLTQTGLTASGQSIAAVLRKSAAATVTAATAGTHLLKNNPANPTSNATLSTSGTGLTASAEGTNGEQTSKRAFNNLNGYDYNPFPEGRLLVPASGIVALTFLAAPSSATWYGEMVVREIRGA